jgi:hypothetical protein
MPPEEEEMKKLFESSYASHKTATMERQKKNQRPAISASPPSKNQRSLSRIVNSEGDFER